MDREYMQEVINGMRKIVKPYLAKQLKKINFEGCGNTDKAEFETDFEIVLTLAEKALAIPSAEPQVEQWKDFVLWVAKEIFDEWEYNKDTFAEIACRKLAKLGIVRAKGDEWELIEPQEVRDK